MPFLSLCAEHCLVPWRKLLYNELLEESLLCCGYAYACCTKPRRFRGELTCRLYVKCFEYNACITMYGRLYCVWIQCMHSKKEEKKRKLCRSPGGLAQQRRARKAEGRLVAGNLCCPVTASSSSVICLLLLIILVLQPYLLLFFLLLLLYFFVSLAPYPDSFKNGMLWDSFAMLSCPKAPIDCIYHKVQVHALLTWKICTQPSLNLITWWEARQGWHYILLQVLVSGEIPSFCTAPALLLGKEISSDKLVLSHGKVILPANSQ